MSVVYPKLLDLVIIMILGKEYKLRSFSLCSFLYHPGLSSFLGQDVLHSTLFSPWDGDQFLHEQKWAAKILYLYLYF